MQRGASPVYGAVHFEASGILGRRTGKGNIVDSFVDTIVREELPWRICPSRADHCLTWISYAFEFECLVDEIKGHGVDVVHLGEVAHAPQQAIGDPRCAARATRDLLGGRNVQLHV